MDQNGHECDHLLGTQEYQAGDTFNENSQFLRKDLVNLEDDRIDILKKHKLENNEYFTRVYEKPAESSNINYKEVSEVSREVKKRFQ